MKSKISNLIKANKNLSVSIFFTLLTLLIYKEWYIFFVIFFSTLQISLIINLINWPYKVFKGESFSFFKQFKVWLSIIPTFISIFLLIYFFAIIKKSNSSNLGNDKNLIERKFDQSKVISSDGNNFQIDSNDEIQMKLKQLENERKRIEDNIEKRKQ